MEFNHHFNHNDIWFYIYTKRYHTPCLSQTVQHTCTQCFHPWITSNVVCDSPRASGAPLCDTHKKSDLANSIYSCSHCHVSHQYISHLDTTISMDDHTEIITLAFGLHHSSFTKAFPIFFQTSSNSITLLPHKFAHSLTALLSVNVQIFMVIRWITFKW